MPDFKVYFDGNFWGHKKYERSGREVKINKEFIFGGKKWLIPSVYICTKGLVIDFCTRFEIKDFESFLKKWKDKAQSGKMSLAEYERFEAENPSCLNFTSFVLLNDKTLKLSHSSSMCYYPKSIGKETHTPELKELMEYYDLKKDSGYVFTRACYEWKTVKKPNIKSLEVNLSQLPNNVSSCEFSALEGEKIKLIHPKTKKEYVLTVKSLEQEVFDKQHFADDEYDYPQCFCTLSYTINTDMTDEDFFVRDINKSDMPKAKDEASSEYRPASSVGLIVGFDKNSEKELHHASSSLYFEPQENIKWQLVWSEKSDEDISIKLI